MSRSILKMVYSAGLKPATFSFEGRHAIHCATSRFMVRSGGIGQSSPIGRRELEYSVEVSSTRTNFADWRLLLCHRVHEKERSYGAFFWISKISYFYFCGFWPSERSAFKSSRSLLRWSSVRMSENGPLPCSFKKAPPLQGSGDELKASH